MAEAETLKIPSTDSRLLRLMSVSFKEASLDSPSFRASMNFYHTQIEAIESWLENTTKFASSKYKSAFQDFRPVHDTMIKQMLPPVDFLSNGVVENQDRTPFLVGQSAADMEELSKHIFRVLYGNPEPYLAVLLEIMTNVVEPYKEKRKDFDYYQSKYDTFLARYHAIKISNTNIEPSSIREDAFQLFDFRKRYLQASLDLTWEVSRVQSKLDELVVKMVGVVLPDEIYQNEASTNRVCVTANTLDSYKQYQKWCQELLRSNGTLSKDIAKAKKQIEDLCVKQCTPSRELNDYNVQTVNKATFTPSSGPDKEALPEKAGWLFMKTTVGTPTRTVWVRRWCFLKKSVFGMLLLSPSKTYVEETDKFGVLLTSVRYDPDEDRKFCFEIKIVGGNVETSPGGGTRSGSGGGSNGNGNGNGNGNDSNLQRDITLVFQTETLQELKQWLQVFGDAKKRVLLLDYSDLEYEMAFTRYPPMFFEFACSSATHLDPVLTTIDEGGVYGKSLLELINAEYSEYGDIHLPEDGLFQMPRLKTPITTKLTKLSVLSNVFVVNDGVPNALMANFWGSVNWGDYCMEESQTSGKSLGPGSQRAHGRDEQAKVPAQNPKAGLDVPNGNDGGNTSPKWRPLMYPDFYPDSLTTEDIQFRSLFHTRSSGDAGAVGNELLLLKFSCTWSANPKQFFLGTCYVTLNHLFFYMNSMGFVCLIKKDLADLVAVEVLETVGDAKEGLLKIYDLRGLSMRTSIFFASVEAIAAKLQYLLENKIRQKPRGQEETLKQFLEYDQQCAKRDKADKDSEKSSTPKQQSGNPKAEDNALLWCVGLDVDALWQRKRQFQTEFPSAAKFSFDVPSKGLMHVLFGDKSSVFPRALFLAHRSGLKNTVTAWTPRQDGDKHELVRKVRFKLDLTRNFVPGNEAEHDTRRQTGKYVEILQNVTRIKEGLYYEVDQSTGYFRAPFTSPFRIFTKYVIIQHNASQRGTEAAAATVGRPKSPEGTCSLYFFHRLQFFDDATGKPLERLGPLDRLMCSTALRFCRYESLLIKHSVDPYLKAIGRHGKVVKAVKLCGQLGVLETDPGTEDFRVDMPENDVRYSKALAVKFLFKWVIFRIVNMLFTAIRVLFTMLYSLATNVVMLNRLVLAVLLLSVLLNMFLTGKTTVSYWSVRKAESILENYANGANKRMERAIYIKDLDLLADQLTDDGNPCLNEFFKSSQEVGNKYRKTRHELAVRRNELLVELKILNSMERELVQGDYRTFLLAELDRCNTVSTEYPGVWSNDTRLQEYCLLCEQERAREDQLPL